ncbi:MAG: DUF924 family protein [Flavobacteriales bacterium TMED235]|nr:MAG: DUF924 family protein [Flavobacteriales bacterium TMED235]
MHSENLTSQIKTFALIPKQHLSKSLLICVATQKIIAKFGMLPHKNTILGGTNKT